MIPPALPPDETERLAALRGLSLLDTPPEERFDRITRLAQTLFDAPIALISLVDADRQWFKSRQGLDAEQTPRSVSFCGHAILGSGVFEVPDATQDERFRDNPLVTGAPGLRFYAGAPLRSPDGRKVGTLCLADSRARRLTDAQKRALTDLAALAEDELGQSAALAPLPVPPGSDPAVARRRTRRDRLVAGAFAAMVGLLLTAAAVSYRRAHRLGALVRDAVRAQGVLRGLEAAASASAEARTASRAYVATRSAGFERLTRDAVRRRDARLAALRPLLHDAPDQRRRLAAAQEAAARGDDADFDAALSQMESSERAALAADPDGVDDEVRGLVLVASFARDVGTLVLLGAFLLLRRYVAERTSAEDALTEARDAALRDARERRRAQEEVRRLSERLHAVLDQIDDGVIVVESNGDLTLFNRAAERIHGAWRVEIERVMKSGLHPPLREDFLTPLPPSEDPMARALKGETVRDGLVRLRTPFRPNGYTIRASATPLRSPQELVTGAVLVFREVA